MIATKKIINQWWLAGLLLVLGGRIWAAAISWSVPVTISNRTDVCTAGTLDRAYCFGSDRAITVNGVPFMPMNVPEPGRDVSLPATVADGQTELAVAGDGDGLFSERNILADDLAVSPQDYQALLASGISDGGSAMALNLAGLVPGRAYLLQVWINDSRNSSAREILAGGSIISGAVRFNHTAVYGDAGQYVIGTFVADDVQQAVTFSAGDKLPLLNACQLRSVPENAALAIAQQPMSTSGYANGTAKFSVLVLGGHAPTYQWQKLSDGRTIDLYDDNHIVGSTNNELIVNGLSTADEGSYRVLIHNDSGSIASTWADLSLLRTSGELINVDIKNGQDDQTVYDGNGVLVGNSSHDYWNGINGRNGFANAKLLDSGGMPTEVTMTLSKPREDGYTRDNIQNNLFKDYSPASEQTITLNHLEPEAYYNLVVYCLGRAPNEGGVLSGAVKGIVYGGYVEDDFWASRFILGTNYIQNPFAKSDANGSLQFTIKATATIMPNGYMNGDLDGLQIRRMPASDLAPAFVLQPKTTSVYSGQPVVLNVNAIAPPSSPLTYQWQRLFTNGVNHLADDYGMAGFTNQNLTISNLTASSTGDYRVVATGSYGASTSIVAHVSVQQPPDLINVDIKNSSEVVPVYNGVGVLRAAGGNIWNGINGRTSFADIPLLDSDGNPTIVTISLIKDQVDSYTSPKTSNNLLRDYSVGHPQTIVLKGLAPDSHYCLVVYSYGAMENEGGVFSGAVMGTAHGWNGSPNGTTDTFIRGTNYIENNSARTDSNGALSFTIQPTSTVMHDGFYNADFNGLQIMSEK